MTNPHFEIASYTLERVIKPLDAVNAMAHAQIAQVHATLAVAFELRTANLIAALSGGFYLGHEHEDTAWADEVMPRLDLGETK